MSTLEVTVNLPTAVLHISKDGCRYTPTDDRDTGWIMPLERAREALEFAYHSVLLFIPAGERDIAPPLRREGDVPTELLADSGGSDPSRTPPPSAPYCPFCKTPTCKCWDSHDCR